MRRWVLNAPGRNLLRALYRRGLRTAQQFLGLDLPINSNTKLIEAWRRVMDKRLPTLVIAAHHPAAQPGFDHLAYLKAYQQPNFTSATIEGTTHSLLEGNGGKALQTHCGNWLRRHFPAQSFAGNV